MSPGLQNATWVRGWAIPQDTQTGAMQQAMAQQQIQQAIDARQKELEKAKIQIILRPINNGFVLTLEHKGVKHERAVTDFSEIGAQVMVALAAINLEG